MCGKFVSISNWKNIAGEFDLGDTNQIPVTPGDIYPGQDAACIIRMGKNNYGVNLHWGFFSRWANRKSSGSLLINARAETLSQKASFRDAFQRRRCLIAADGFYEWSKEKKQICFFLLNKKPFGLAGIYEPAIVPGAAQSSFVIITTSPNDLIAPLHDRMPVIIPADKQSLWLENGEYDIRKLTTLLNPYPASEMAMCEAGFPASHI
jgi:putative SOS response-associated peptidase YedK